ncbi:MAG TPA: tetratricopeptide repeat protein, partial [Allosphingosinicella sp.]|nr:tetratricopeptide repeat protein [Allosphingosinicella sp.]
AAAAVAEPERRFGPRTTILAATALLLAGATAIGFAATSAFGGEEPARHQPSQKARDLYLAGLYHWERRTADSLGRAQALFGQAIAEDPLYAEPHAGRANAYLLLREYAGMPDAEAYPRARAAAERALALDERLPEAHLALAFVTFYWNGDFERGLSSFERAIALDPSSPRAHHWYATALYHAGRGGRALAAIDDAQRLAPDSRSVLADKGLILFEVGRSAEAVALLGQISHSEPDFLSPPRYLAMIHLAEGDLAAFLGQARKAARLARDEDQLAVLDAAERGWRSGGRDAMFRAMLAVQLRLREAGRETDYALAVTHAQLGDRAAALRQLEAAFRSRDPQLVGLRVDPKLRALHGDSAFRRLAQRVGTSAG